MPKLKQSPDKHYYIRDGKPYRTPQTFQIREKGLEYLKQQKVEVDGHISPAQLKWLQDHDLVFIKEEGPPSQLVQPTVSPSQQREEHIFLTFEPTAQSWELSLFIPELPEEWLQAIKQGHVRGCGFAIIDDKLRHVVRLENFTKKARYLVNPQLSVYTVEPRGSWPSDWDKNRWIHDVAGLNPSGMLFGDEKSGCIRLHPKQVVFPGNAYFFVSSQTQSIPHEISPHSLGTRNSWRAWRVLIPEKMNTDVHTQVAKWCAGIGHPLKEPSLQLTLISPPALQYTPKGVPMLKAAQDVLIKIAFPKDAVRVAEECELLVECDGSLVAQSTQSIRGQGFFSFPLPIPGEYAIRERNGQVRPFTFTVTSSSSQKMNIPEPLKIIVSSEQHTLNLSAFDEIANQNGKYEIDLALFGKESVLTVGVFCPVPIDVTWSCGSKRGQRRGIDTGSVKDYLAECLPFAFEFHEKFSLTIDAGTFGWLDLYLNPPPNMELSIANLPPIVVQRMRWLTSAIMAQAQQGRQVPLPQNVRATLGALAIQADVIPWARRTHVPEMLLPHACALAYTVERYSGYGLAHDGHSK